LLKNMNFPLKKGPFLLTLPTSLSFTLNIFQKIQLIFLGKSIIWLYVCGRALATMPSILNVYSTYLLYLIDFGSILL
jgi:hypothetical protein